MEQFEAPIRRSLAAHTGLPEAEVRIEVPRDAALGDLAFPCFALAKTLRKAPPAIAAELAAAVEGELEGIDAAATGPYVNFTIERALLARSVIEQVLEEGERYGDGTLGGGETVVIDLSSPNIAKPMSVGHLRSTVIGAAIQRILDALGYRTVAINHIGDWGSQFGKLVAAIDRWGESVDLEADPIRSLLALYVRFHEEEEEDPSLAEAARTSFRELESGVEGPVRATWRRLTELSLGEFDKIYERLGVTFQLVRGEAYFEPMLEETVDRIASVGITEVSEGALIVDLSEIAEGMPPCLLRKSDGTTLYATRDMAALFHRWEEYAFHRCLYVVGADQKLHFRQLKAVLQRMGLEWEPRVEHVWFGMLRLPEGKMSTRKGRVVFLEEVLDRARDEALAIIEEKNPDLAGASEIAEQVGVGAVVFNDLKRERIKDIEFEWDEVLSFEGETGPYVQYTHARLASILRRAEAAGEGGADPDWGALEEAAGVLLRIGRFPAVLRSAGAHAEPSEVTTWVLGLCREVNAWYTRHRVLGQEPALTEARLALVRASATAIARGLAILGLTAPREM
ncbi:MAG: arginine--tRNA ligase [Planctomycetota bacterium]|jgi:arginyl-tRNA synthetase|nr:arginine--tRNA ligase [Planctomycetota bacterium]MDP6990673.1 arginine--tRNA ligase [Planctomycetota bacterium]